MCVCVIWQECCGGIYTYVLSAFKHQVEGIDCNLIQRLYLLPMLRLFIAEPETQCSICIHIYFTLIE